MSPPKPQTYSSKPVKLDEPENEPDKAAIEYGKKFGIGTPEHIERLRKMLQARDMKEEALNEISREKTKKYLKTAMADLKRRKDEAIHNNPVDRKFSRRGGYSNIMAVKKLNKTARIPATEEYLGEKILTSSRNLIGKRVTINNPKVSSWHGRTGRVEKVFNNGYIGIKFRNVDHVVELHPSDIGKIRPGI